MGPYSPRAPVQAPGVGMVQRLGEGRESITSAWGIDVQIQTGGGSEWDQPSGISSKLLLHTQRECPLFQRQLIHFSWWFGLGLLLLHTPPPPKLSDLWWNRAIRGDAWFINNKCLSQVGIWNRIFGNYKPVLYSRYFPFLSLKSILKKNPSTPKVCKDSDYPWKMDSAFLQLKELLSVNLNPHLFNVFNQMSTPGSLQMKHQPQSLCLEALRHLSLCLIRLTHPILGIIMFLNSQEL